MLYVPCAHSRCDGQFELRRFCRATNAVALIKLDPPTPDELGFAGTCFVEEIGGTRCTVMRQADAASAVTTVVLRGATENVMDDVERAVDDGVNGALFFARTHVTSRSSRPMLQRTKRWREMEGLCPLVERLKSQSPLDWQQQRVPRLVWSSTQSPSSLPRSRWFHAHSRRMLDRTPRTYCLLFMLHMRLGIRVRVLTLRMEAFATWARKPCLICMRLKRGLFGLRVMPWSLF